MCVCTNNRPPFSHNATLLHRQSNLLLLLLRSDSFLKPWYSLYFAQRELINLAKAIMWGMLPSVFINISDSLSIQLGTLQWWVLLNIIVWYPWSYTLKAALLRYFHLRSRIRILENPFVISFLLFSGIFQTPSLLIGSLTAHDNIELRLWLNPSSIFYALDLFVQITLGLKALNNAYFWIRWRLSWGLKANLRWCSPYISFNLVIPSVIEETLFDHILWTCDRNSRTSTKVMLALDFSLYLPKRKRGNALFEFDKLLSLPLWILKQ
jgi:hypothetical protein